MGCNCLQWRGGGSSATAGFSGYPWPRAIRLEDLSVSWNVRARPASGEDMGTPSLEVSTGATDTLEKLKPQFLDPAKDLPKHETFFAASCAKNLLCPVILLNQKQ